MLAESLGVNSDLPRATDSVNTHQIGRLVAKVRENVGEGAVAVLGLAYKPFTPVIDESQGVMIARDLAAEGKRVTVFDPLAMDNARNVLGYRVTYAEDLQSRGEGGRHHHRHHPRPRLRRLGPGA